MQNSLNRQRQNEFAMTSESECNDDTRAGAGDYWARARRWLWIPLVVCALAIVGASWALSSPIGSSPDDDFHLGSIWCSPLAPDELCQPTKRPAAELSSETVAAVDGGVKLVRVPTRVGPEALCFAFDGTASAACQDGIEPGFSETRANDGLYPKGLYTFLGLFVSEDAGRSVVIIRLASFTISLSLIVAALMIADRSVRQSYALAVLATSIPLGVFVFASTNPSGVAVASTGAAFVCAVTFLRASDQRETAISSVIGLLAVAVALSSRADTGLYLGAACACAVIVERAWRRPFWLRAGILGGVAMIGLFWLTLSTQTSATADGIGGLKGTQPMTAVLWDNIITLPALWVGSLGVGWGLGWLDTRLPDVVGMGLVTAAGGLLLWGLGDVRRSKLISGGLALLTITVVPLWILAADRRLVGEAVQPRYLLPMLPVLMTILLLPARQGLRRLNRTQLVVLGTVFSVAHALSLHANIRRYVSGQELRGVNLNSQVEWWWSIGVSPMTIWVLGSSAFAIVVVVAVAKCATAPGTDPGERLLEGGTPPGGSAEQSTTEDENVLPVEWDPKEPRPAAQPDRSTERQVGAAD